MGTDGAPQPGRRWGWGEEDPRIRVRRAGPLEDAKRVGCWCPDAHADPATCRHGQYTRAHKLTRNTRVCRQQITRTQTPRDKPGRRYALTNTCPHVCACTYTYTHAHTMRCTHTHTSRQPRGLECPRMGRHLPPAHPAVTRCRVHRFGSANASLLCRGRRG